VHERVPGYSEEKRGESGGWCHGSLL